VPLPGERPGHRQGSSRIPLGGPDGIINLQCKTVLELHVIDCDSIHKANLYFLQLRILRQPDSARSGKYLLKGPPQSIDWFAKHYGVERYTTNHEPLPKDKK